MILFENKKIRFKAAQKVVYYTFLNHNSFILENQSFKQFTKPYRFQYKVVDN
jgi:hypothetical protein